ncbi:MAG: hypothetical protein OXI74_19480 [Rhodospirillaceae bacterium]|nr:hypothetical protein [Rhodospirillaceae bacterium]
MTTEAETPPQIGSERVLLRQANPLVIRNGKAQKGLFRVDTDPETGERAISVELASPEYSAQDAYERHYGGRPPTMGTVGVSMGEIARLNLIAKPDPLPGNPQHWLLVLPEGVSNSSIQNPLKTFAVARGWLYAPPGTSPLR